MSDKKSDEPSGSSEANGDIEVEESMSWEVRDEEGNVVDSSDSKSQSDTS